MKKAIGICLAAAMMTAALAGCGGKQNDTASKMGSAVSGAMSNVGEAAEDIGEGVTAAASAVVSEADRMYDNGQISDGDGIIGNENEETEQPTTDDTETTEDASIL